MLIMMHHLSLQWAVTLAVVTSKITDHRES